MVGSRDGKCLDGLGGSKFVLDPHVFSGGYRGQESPFCQIAITQFLEGESTSTGAYFGIPCGESLITLRNAVGNDQGILVIVGGFGHRVAKSIGLRQAYILKLPCDLSGLREFATEGFAPIHAGFRPDVFFHGVLGFYPGATRYTPAR